jgi:3-oxoacyl-[acyl-carrier protein] reductase
MGTRFEGKVAIVTGAAKGMGRATAIEIAADGGTVVVTDIDKQGIEETAQLVRSAGGKVRASVCDIQSRTQVDDLILGTKREFGRIDILVNNAGLLLPGSIEETTDDIIDRTLNINVKGILFAIRAATPIMKEQKYGRIVNVSSITGKNGDNSTVFVYGASKGAVISMTKSLAAELAPFGIRVNCVAPGWVATEMAAPALDVPSERQKVLATIPLGRVGTPEEIAAPVIFLCGAGASFITGEIFNVNGGAVLVG